MNPLYLIPVVAVAVSLVVIFLIFGTPGARRKNARIQMIRTCTAVGVDISSSIAKRGDLDAITKFRKMVSDMDEHDIEPEEVGFTNMSHLASDTAKAYRAAIDNFHTIPGRSNFKQNMIEALKIFCGKHSIPVPGFPV